MKNILITGGAGFIGSHLVDSLLTDKNCYVTAIDDFNDFYDPAVKYSNIKRHFCNPFYTIVRGDILSEEFLEKVFSGEEFDCIVHLAARAGVRPSLISPRLYEATNIRGTLNLLEFAKIRGVRQFVFGSSSSVYGNSPHRPFSENDPVNRPVSPYAMTKAAGELMCHTYSQLYDLRCLCLRFFTVYGPRQRPDLAIHKFARLIAEQKSIPVFGDGSTGRDYTFIDDIVSGIKAAINFDQSRFEIFNLGESQTVQLKYLINLLEETLGEKAVIDRQPLQPGDVDYTCADISKARCLLGYNPQTTIENGIKKFISWFNSSNVAGDELSNPGSAASS